jgi:threonine/homoserine/homoserine lactone efflux protein
MSFLLKGIVLGFSIAAPVGPIGVLCIRRTLTEGRLAGLVAGLGAATADAFYGSVAGFGLAAISGFLIGYAHWFRLLGGLFLISLGVKTFFALPVEREVAARRGLLGGYLSTLFLTLTNPMTILSFGAVFAGLGLLGTAGNYAAAAMLVAGVFCGSALWWLVLSSGVAAVAARVAAPALRWLNWISGLVLEGFGWIVLVGAWR